MDEKIEIRPGRTVNILRHSHPTANQTVFLLHGLGGRGEQWLAQYEALKPHYNIIVPDMLGHGKSDKPCAPKKHLYTFQELDQDIKALFKRYASEHNIVAGHSYGGALATSLALAHHHAVEKLILISPTPLAPETNIPFLFTLPTIAMEWLRPVLEKSMARLIFTSNADPTLVNKEIVASRQNPMHVIKSTINGFLSMPRADVSHLTTPTLVLLGQQDKLIPPTLSLQFYQALPNHKMVMLPTMSHMSILEEPAEVNARMLRWCR